MGYLGRRIGLSQDNGDSNPGAAGGAVGGGLLDLFTNGYFERQGDLYNAPGAAPLPPSGLTATGGVISDYTDGPAVYRAHIFTSSGTFNVSAPGTFGDTVEYLVVAGGGGGGAYSAGGGGAGGLRTNLTGNPLAGAALPVSTSPGSYTVTVGSGGAGRGYAAAGAPNSDMQGGPGNPSSFGPVSTTGGGGGAGWGTPSGVIGGPGGSGGGGSGNEGSPAAGGTATNYPGPTQQGFPGGTGTPSSTSADRRGGGGGGAGAVGYDGGPPNNGIGGAGLQIAIAGPAANTTGVGALNPGPGEYQWFAGGGGGGCHGPTSSYPPGVVAPGGVGGGGSGGAGPGNVATPGTFSTGSGGGGGNSTSTVSGSGGSGIVVVRYKIAELTATAKATGGAISFYSGKTIHAFTSSGQFICPGPFSETCEYVVIGGGGSGGSGSANTNSSGGGGGAGTYRTSSVAITSGTYNVTIGAGGGKNNGSNNGSQGGTTTLALPSSVASPGGGYGYPGPTPGYDGGSSGGTVTQSTTATGDPFPGTIGATPTSGWGHIGNNASSIPAYNTGGGGGAGGAAPPQPGANLSPGGIGIQIPSTFRNPVSTVGAPGPTSPAVTGADTSGKFYVAGGGGGAAGHPQPAQPKGGDGGFGGGGDGGGIDPNGNSFTGNGFDATQNTGSGGGGGPTGDNTFSGGGGSGIVIIAYPS